MCCKVCNGVHATLCSGIIAHYLGEVVISENESPDLPHFCRTGDHALTASGMAVPMALFTPSSQHVHHVAASPEHQEELQARAVQVHERWPEVEALPSLLHTALALDSEATGAQFHTVQPHEIIKLVGSGTLVAKMSWQGEGVLQNIRTTPTFLGSPWFDCVALKAPSEGEEWFAQLRVLFWFRGKAYALVRWFDVVLEGVPDVLVQHGCVPLKWCATGSGGPVHDVVELATVIRRVYVVPDWSQKQGGRFHVSVFKWERLPPKNIGGEAGFGEST